MRLYILIKKDAICDTICFGPRGNKLKNDPPLKKTSLSLSLHSMSEHIMYILSVFA